MSKHKQSDGGIRLIMIDGPVQCHVPIPRSDLPRGTVEFELPYRWGRVVYRLDRVENGIHVFRHDPIERP